MIIDNETMETPVNLVKIAVKSIRVGMQKHRYRLFYLDYKTVRWHCYLINIELALYLYLGNLWSLDVYNI